MDAREGRKAFLDLLLEMEEKGELNKQDIQQEVRKKWSGWDVYWHFSSFSLSLAFLKLRIYKMEKESMGLKT